MKRYKSLFESLRAIKYISLLGNGKAYVTWEKEHGTVMGFERPHTQFSNNMIFQLLDNFKEQDRITFEYTWPTKIQDFERQLNLICKKAGLKIIHKPRIDDTTTRFYYETERV